MNIGGSGLRFLEHNFSWIAHGGRNSKSCSASVGLVLIDNELLVVRGLNRRCLSVNLSFYEAVFVLQKNQALVGDLPVFC